MGGVLDTDLSTLRTQAQWMARLTPEQRVRRALAWSAELLAASCAAWMQSAPSGDAVAQRARLDAWIRAQHGEGVASGFAAAREAWLQRQATRG